MKVTLLKPKAKNQGGLEKATMRIASYFVQRGAEVTLLTTGSSKAPSLPAPINTIRLPVYSWPPFIRLEQFDRKTALWQKSNPSDVVLGLDRTRTQTHIRAGNGVHAAFLETRLRSANVFKRISLTINPLHRKILQIEKQAYESPELKKIFTNSRMVRDEIFSYYAVDPTKIEVIHNGVEWYEMEVDFSCWAAKKSSICQSLGLHPDRFQFLFVGNGYERKGLMPLLHALAPLRDRPFDLSIVGKERAMHFYRRQAANLGLGDNVHFFGQQNQIRPFYQAADAIVIPSFYDPFANVTVEALAMGLYVLTSKHNGGAEILTVPTNGQVLPDINDPISFALYLDETMKRRNTEQSALLARQSVQHLDFSHQLNILVDSCYAP